MVQSQSLERFDVVPLMTADEARECVVRINGHMNSARAELLRLYESRGWVALGYASWRECVVNEFDKSKTTLYQELEAAQIEQRISANGGIGLIPERQLRPLGGLTPIEQPAAWQRAQEIAEDSGERLSSRHVEQAVEEMASRLVIVPRTTENTDLIGDGVDDAVDPPMEPAQVADLPPSRINAGLFTSATPEWYTPRHIIDRVLKVFDGEIDLDPCSNSLDPNEANVPAGDYFTAELDGLSRERQWHGRVYMNPPYGDEIPQWVDRLVQAKEGDEIDEAIALLPARVDTNWFQPLWAYELCFVKGRLRFSGAENSAPFPSVVVYLGPDVEGFKRHFREIGPCGRLR